MTASEFLNEKGMFYTDIIGKDDKVKLIDIIEQYAKLYHESELKKLRVTDVSGRSEQLIDFAVKEGYFEGVPKGNLMGLIDRFEKSINCH